MEIDGDNSITFHNVGLTSDSSNVLLPSPITSSGTSSSFGLLVPGGPVRTDFVPVDANKLALTLTCPGDVPAPLQSVTELVLFSTTLALPMDQGVLCYWQVASTRSAETTGFAVLGSISAARPSAVFSTRWSENEQLIDFLARNGGENNSGGQFTITIGLSLEPVANIANVDVTAATNATNDKLFVAQKIAADLFRFMQSFDTGGNNNNRGMMMVPVNIFDRWFQRFEARFRRDPNFFLKQTSE